VFSIISNFGRLGAERCPVPFFHAHIDFSDERNGFGGHLEEGCLALTFTIVALADLGEVKLSHWDTFKNEAELR